MIQQLMKTRHRQIDILHLSRNCEIAQAVTSTGMRTTRKVAFLHLSRQHLHRKRCQAIPTHEHAGSLTSLTSPKLISNVLQTIPDRLLKLRDSLVKFCSAYHDIGSVPAEQHAMRMHISRAVSQSRSSVPQDTYDLKEI